MITIRLMGGLGNQMFQYAALRATMLDFQENGQISLVGITNKTHNVFALNNFNINNNISIIEKTSLKLEINHFIYGLYYLILLKRKNGLNIMKKISNILNNCGIYCVPDGYIPLNFSKSKNKTMVGYFQSLKYFDKYSEIIKNELTVNTTLSRVNKNIIKKMNNCESVCLHIRKGDYVGSNLDVCTKKYYYDAIKVMNNKISNACFYVFSDDIKWVKKNLKFDVDVIYMDYNNSAYDELRLMYNCKNFIISNSSFSWWAQYLSRNEKKVVIAPSKWFKNQNQKIDVYERNWILINL